MNIFLCTISMAITVYVIDGKDSNFSLFAVN